MTLDRETASGIVAWSLEYTEIGSGIDLRVLIWLQGHDYYPLIGHNPALLLACSLDITP
jgi:hypothetical protein